MKFTNLILKNILRNKSRSLLALIGIAIGVAAVVGLGLITDNLSESTQSALTAGAADFSVVNVTNSASGASAGGGAGPGEQFINQTSVTQLQQISGVGSAVGVLRTMTNLNSTVVQALTVAVKQALMAISDQ